MMPLSASSFPRENARAPPLITCMLFVRNSSSSYACACSAPPGDALTSSTGLPIGSSAETSQSSPFFSDRATPVGVLRRCRRGTRGGPGTVRPLLAQTLLLRSQGRDRQMGDAVRCSPEIGVAHRGVGR